MQWLNSYFNCYVQEVTAAEFVNVGRVSSSEGMETAPFVVFLPRLSQTSGIDDMNKFHRHQVAMKFLSGWSTIWE